MSWQTAAYKRALKNAKSGDLAARSLVKDVLIRCITGEEMPYHVLIRLGECLVESYLEECEEWAKGN